MVHLWIFGLTTFRSVASDAYNNSAATRLHCVLNASGATNVNPIRSASYVRSNIEVRAASSGTTSKVHGRRR